MMARHFKHACKFVRKRTGQGRVCSFCCSRRNSAKPATRIARLALAGLVRVMITRKIIRLHDGSMSELVGIGCLTPGIIRS